MGRAYRSLIVALVLLQVVISVAFPSLVRNEITCNLVHAQTTYSVFVDSYEDNQASWNKGTIGGSITVGGAVIYPPQTVMKPAGVYEAVYWPVWGYTFLRWEIYGGVSVSSSSLSRTDVTVTGSGSLRAIYTVSVTINLDSEEEFVQTRHKGQITLPSPAINLPADCVTHKGVSVKYWPDDDYTFVRWESGNGVSVSNPNSASTTLTSVGDSGWLRAIYRYTGSVAIHLESREDNGASTNKGTITLAGVASNLPGDVTKLAGTYPVSYSPVSEYTFVRWEAGGCAQVSSSRSASTTLIVPGPYSWSSPQRTGTLTAIYRKSAFAIHLESAQDNGASTNKGSITLAGVPSSLPADVTKLDGTYSVSYSPNQGYGFVRWEVSGGVSVLLSGSTYVSSDMHTDVTVTGAGTLKAVYVAAFNIHLESAQDDGASTNKGGISVSGVGITVRLPSDIGKATGAYTIWYQPDGGYTFVRWEVSGGVSVSSSSNYYTSLTVTGAGTLRAIYSVPGFVIRLESAQDNGASVNKGTITLAGVSLIIPADVTKATGVHSISYSAASGYAFVRWETTGSVSVANAYLGSTSLTVAGAGTLKAIYGGGHVIHLVSEEGYGKRTNKGTISLAGVVYSLPADVTKPQGAYSVAYTPASGCTFLFWDADGVSVSDHTLIVTQWPGTLRAIYRNDTAATYRIHFESGQDNGASTNKGSMTFPIAAVTYSILPAIWPMPGGVYQVSYSSATGYVFLRWETTGSVSVASLTSSSTSLTVTGAGTLKAIYRSTSQTLYRIDLKSGEDGGTTSNTGEIKFAAVTYSQLPAQVSKAAGSYSISYSPATGYVFLRWQASGAIVVTQLSSKSTTATVTGQGTLIAVYRKGTVHRQPLPFGVALSLETDKQSVQAGQSASFKINVRLVYGSAPVVSLDLTDRPDNANYSFSMPSGTPPYSSDLTISTDPSTPSGTYVCTITCSALEELSSTSVTLIVEGFKSPSLLSITTRSSTVEEGESVTVTGSLVPYLPATIQLIYRNPAGTEITRQVSTDTGNFTDTFKPDTSGDWSVKAKWAGDSDLEGSESQLTQFSVKASPLKTILPITVIAVVAIASALFFYLRKKRAH